MNLNLQMGNRSGGNRLPPGYIALWQDGVDIVGLSTIPVQPGRALTGNGTAYVSITGLLTTDTILADSTGQPTCTTNGRLDIANGVSVWGVSITRSGQLIGYFPCGELAGVCLVNVCPTISGRLADGVLSTAAIRTSLYTGLGWDLNQSPSDNSKIATEKIRLLRGGRNPATPALGATLGAEMVDAGAFSSTTGSWTPFGSNAVVLDSPGIIKITYVNNATGAYLPLRNSANLTSHLTIGCSYYLTCKAKVNTGNAQVGVDCAVPKDSKYITSTSEWSDVAVQFVASSATANYVRCLSMGAGEIIYIKDISLKPVDTSLQNSLPPVVLSVTGDSIAMGLSGGVNYYSYFNSTSEFYSGQELINANFQPSYRLSNNISQYLIPFYNAAKNGQTWAWVLSTGAPAAIATGAKAVLIHCGVNDVGAGRTWAQVESDMNAVKALLQPHQHLFIDEITPWGGTSDAYAETIRTWNANYATWCSNNGATLTPMHDQFGKLRVSTGYLDDLKDAYNDGSGLHLTQTGIDVMATLWLSSLETYYGSPCWTADDPYIEFNTTRVKYSLVEAGSVFSWPHAPDILTITGVDNAVFNADGSGKEFATPALSLAAMATVEDNVHLFVGAKGAVLYTTDTSTELAKIQKAGY